MLEFSVPDQLDDIAPPFAANLARCRQRALDWLAAHDYQLIIPPLADYLETLTGGDEALNISTFKITDTLTNHTLGIRADQTPQIARFDAGRRQNGVRRYCYCGPTLRTCPPQPCQGRESMQLGAELFGAPAGGGDWEIASLALGTLRAMGVDDICIDVGHADLFSAATAALSPAQRHELIDIVGRRDGAAIETRMADGEIDAASGRALLPLVQSEAGDEILAAVAAALPAAQPALQTLQEVSQQLRAEQYDCAFNLSDLGSYGYHSGIVFTIYGKDRLLARGGRYRHSGDNEGVGFSTDLRAVCELVALPSAAPAVNVPLMTGDEQWRQAVEALRAAGRRLRFFYAAEGEEPPLPALCSNNGKWDVRES